MSVKVIRRQVKVTLYAKMMENSLCKQMQDKQIQLLMLLKNRLTLLNDFDCELLHYSDNKLQIELKKSLKMATQNSGSFSPWQGHTLLKIRR